RGSTTCSTSPRRGSRICRASRKRRSMHLVLSTIPTVGDWHASLRLGVAAILGGAIGVERELRDREAGIRTHLLVSMGSALFTLVSAYGFHSFLASGDTVVP